MTGSNTTVRKGGLGRGLAALIPTGPPPSPSTGSTDAPAADNGASGAGASGNGASAPVAASPAVGAGPVDGANPPNIVAGAVYQELPISAITPNPKQPRQVFDEEALSELSFSIREFGLMQPIVVRETSPGSYELVMGERRWRASQRAELEHIPAIVRSTTDDSMLRDALLENIHRVQLNPLEEAAAYQQLLDEFEVTHEQLAGRIGRSRPVITNTIRLLRLPIAVQRRVAAGVLSAGHARALLGLDQPELQEELAARIVAEGLSVRATEEAVTLSKHDQPAKAKPASRKPLQAPGLQAAAERLSDRFDTRVKVEFGRRKGRIVVEFGSVDDLERIVSMMDENRTNQAP